MSTAPTTPAATSGSPDLLAELLALETAAMDRWGAGDPDGFLGLSDDDVSYFDPWQPDRLDSRAELARVYDEMRGQVHIDAYEFVEPAVVAAGDLAVLSFQSCPRGPRVSGAGTRRRCTGAIRTAAGGSSTRTGR